MADQSEKTAAPVRVPLRERIEALTAGRWRAVLLIAALGLAAVIVNVVTYVVSRDPAVLAMLVITTVGLGGATWLAWWTERREGRSRVGAHGIVLQVPTPWPPLTRALESFVVRSAIPAPAVGYVPRTKAGGRVDAELVFMEVDAPIAEPLPVKGLADRRVSDAPLILFDEAMLDCMDEDELLAVIYHLMFRLQLASISTTRVDNGVREADSRTLLATHDHLALLRALEKSTKDRSTSPELGRIRFADADLRINSSFTSGRGGEWQTRDRLAELRDHLMAAALDVPEGQEPTCT